LVWVALEPALSELPVAPELPELPDVPAEEDEPDVEGVDGVVATVSPGWPGSPFGPVAPWAPAGPGTAAVGAGVIVTLELGGVLVVGDGVTTVDFSQAAKPSNAKSAANKMECFIMVLMER
jgi:hypothetical protein